jgi:hypothetical protein
MTVTGAFLSCLLLQAGGLSTRLPRPCDRGTTRLERSAGRPTLPLEGPAEARLVARADGWRGIHT